MKINETFTSTSKNAILFTTHFFNDFVLSQYRKLRDEVSSTADVVLLIQIEEEISMPTDVVYYEFSIESLKSLGFNMIENAIVPGSNHFPLLQFFIKYPNYQYYWSIEYDVHFSGEWNMFLKNFENDTNDFISSHIQKYSETPDWCWWNSMKMISYVIPEVEYIKSFNPIYRISNLAVGEIKKFLTEGNSGHHEVVIPTVLNYSGFSLEDFSTAGTFHSKHEQYYITSGSLDTNDPSIGSTMRYRPVYENITELICKNKLYHPVKQQIMNNTINELRKKIISSIDIVQSLGIANGKMGICIFLYEESRRLKDKRLELLADEVFDMVHSNLSENMSFGIENGLMGIGIGIDYLIKKEFIQGDVNQILKTIDNYVFQNICNHLETSITDKDIDLMDQYLTSILHTLLYFSFRLKNKKLKAIDRLILEKSEIKLINVFYRTLSDSLIYEPLPFSIRNKIPLFLLGLRDLAHSNFYTERINCIIHEIENRVLTYFPYIQGNRLMQLWAAESIANYTKKINWVQYARLLRDNICMDDILQKEMKDFNLFFANGISGIYYIGSQYNKIAYQPIEIDKHKVLNRIYSSRLWERLLKDDEYFIDSIGLDGACGLILFTEYLIEKK